MSTHGRILPILFSTMTLLAGAGPEKTPGVAPKVGTVADLTQVIIMDTAAATGVVWHRQIPSANLVPRDVASVTEKSLPRLFQDETQDRTVFGARIFVVPMEPGEKVRLGLSFFAPERYVKFGPLLGEKGPMTTELMRAIRSRLGHRLDVTNVTDKPVTVSYYLEGPISCSYTLTVERKAR